LNEEIILRATNLSKRFGEFAAVSDVDLAVRRGSIHSLIGPNGAGKTTCFNMLSKFLAPSDGQIMFEGRDITAFKPWEVADAGMARSFQLSAVFAQSNARENVRLALQRKQGQSFDFWRSRRVLSELDERAVTLLETVGLKEFAEIPAGALSYGRKRALEVATTLALDPKLLLLDEPMAGMTQEDIERISALIREIARKRTVLMVEHNLSVVAALSDTITVLARGRVLAEGSYADVSANSQVIEAYIGVGHE
jgi:branched-chain amino acid transport system ATP-binding protein